MKFLFRITLFLLFFSTITIAQSISNNTLGLRFSGLDGYGASLTYQKGLSQKNRAELNLGWKDQKDFEAIKFSGIYQWVIGLNGDGKPKQRRPKVRSLEEQTKYIEKQKKKMAKARSKKDRSRKIFNLYLGPGAGFALEGYHNELSTQKDTYIFFAGNLGLEFDPGIPLLFSIDFRPELAMGNTNYAVRYDLGFGIRYQF